MKKILFFYCFLERSFLFCCFLFQRNAILPSFVGWNFKYVVIAKISAQARCKWVTCVQKYCFKPNEWGKAVLAIYMSAKFSRLPICYLRDVNLNKTIRAKVRNLGEDLCFFRKRFPILASRQHRARTLKKFLIRDFYFECNQYNVHYILFEITNFKKNFWSFIGHQSIFIFLQNHF